MTTIYVSNVLKELKRQLRHIERAIVALEGIEQEHPGRNTLRKRKVRFERHVAIEKKTGTTGEVVPFVRRN